MLNNSSMFKKSSSTHLLEFWGKSLSVFLESVYTCLIIAVYCAAIKKYGDPVESDQWEVTSHQSDVTSFTLTLCASRMSQLLTHAMMCLPSCVLHFLSLWIKCTALWERTLRAFLKSERITSSCFPWSVSWVTLSWKEIRFHKKDFPLMKPCWPMTCLSGVFQYLPE